MLNLTRDTRMYFLVILSSLFTYTCYKAAQLNPDHPYLMISVALLFFVLMCSPTLLGRKNIKFSATSWFYVLNWIGSMSIGLFATFILISLPIDTLNLMVKIFTPKIFLTTQTYQIIFYISVAMSLFGFIEVLRGPKIVTVDIPIKAATPSLNGFKIAQISDLHIGPTIKSNYVKKVVQRTSELKADLIVITGDLVDDHFDAVKEHLQFLKDLKAVHGVYYVTGNHEYYWGIQLLIPELQLLGINVLSNTNAIIESNGSKILVAGIPDPTAGQLSTLLRPNIEQSMKSSIDVDLRILLAHRPDPYLAAEKLGVDVQFSGHTHAGQFFPFSLLIPLAHKYYKGLNQYKNLWLYVSPGTGYWGPANRFGVTSEITLAILKSS